MTKLLPLTLEDSFTLEKIHKICFSDGWSQETFHSFLRESVNVGWMAFSEDKNPQGFILGRIIENEVEILTFCVLPLFQRMGIGLSLLRKLLNSVEYKKVFLEVAVDNKKAIDLYLSLGFKEIATRTNYYQRSCEVFISAVVMAYSKDESR